MKRACALDSCRKTTVFPKVFCDEHWKLLPRKHQNRIIDSYVPGGDGKSLQPHGEAVLDAASWLEKLEDRC